MSEKRIKWLWLGIHTIPKSTEDIPVQAAADSIWWISTDWQIELTRGRTRLGAEETANGTVQGHWYGYKADWTTVHFRKINTKIQYYNTTTGLWVDIVTGLTSGAEYTFSPYQSLAGTFMYVTGVDWIYKIHTANPGNFASMYDSTKNWKAKSLIATGRMIMWSLPNDKTGIYGSWIDSQNSAVYTTVTAEALSDTSTGTLARISPICTITIASPWVVTLTGHNLAATSPIKFATTGALPTGITAWTTYYVIAAWLTANTFQFSTTSGGAAVNTSGTQSGVHTIVWPRTVFGVTITDTSSAEVFTDNYSGVLTGSLGGTGTINYMTGAFTTSQSGAGTVDYQWEMTNNKGVTDFSKSATRLAGEWFTFRQDEGWDAIQNITVHNGAYYSLKSRSAYRLTIDTTDLLASNIVFRKDIGMQYWRSSVTTGNGIIFMDTANREQPRLTILTPNAIGDNLEPVILAKQFDFSPYTWDMCAMETFGEFILFSGRTSDVSTNNRLFMYNFRLWTIDILPYLAKTLVEIEGRMYIGDTTTENVYEIFTGFSDDELEIKNYWISWDDLFGTNRLKKVKRFRIKWLITPSQTLQVYMTLDGWTATLVGTILGNGSYVDASSSYTIGANGIGQSIVGWESSAEDGAEYLCELHISEWKFRKLAIKLVATWSGYVSVNMYEYHKIGLFENRIPERYRSKQNVSLDWTLTNQ